ncbi:aldehyde dehydrogenase family protein [Streptomyces aurantiogriseus]|uniref:Aldehyde dehydrogenase n=1 Tax=Streptomyces aurantiogriseus TaxID=66870 RepID=A0A918C2T5_9ACTN|nr:aldehyde dehydrogenase family protein [Streptomyces aurantiogriseus]GGR02732.1 aldehyde dehydrogenase [Streptomyces aurantiogriseus]
MASPAPVAVDPMIAGRTVHSADRVPLTGVLGEPLADIGQAPRLLAVSALRELRKHADGTPPGAEVFRRAADLFADAELDGESPEDYVRRVTLGAGLTTTTVRLATAELTAEMRDFAAVADAELPGTDFGPGNRTRWVPRGRLFAAVLASNHPTPSSSWLQALFHGYSVLVRPGGRDPFTPRRLIAALLHAGLDPHRVAFLPSPHTVGEFLLKEADRGIVYGGDRAVAAWQDHETVAARGPGRAKALVDVVPDDTVLDHLAEYAAFDGGTRCTNLSAVLTTGPVDELADRLAHRLSALPVLPATDPKASLLVLERSRADQLEQTLTVLRETLTDHSARLDLHDPFVRLDDGSFQPRPLVLSADRADHPALGTELPFPFVVVAPWQERDGIAPLSRSLVLNLLTDRDDLVDRAVLEPGIRKITTGTVLPWNVPHGIPHDGSYTQFLLEPKGIVGDGRLGRSVRDNRGDSDETT